MQASEYLDLLKQRHQWTDYRIAQELKVEPQLISKYRRGLRFFPDETAIQIAEWLDLEPLSVLADMHAQRAKSDKVRKVWRQASGVSVFILSLNILAHPSVKTDVPSSANIVHGRDYAQCERRHRRRTASAATARPPAPDARRVLPVGTRHARRTYPFTAYRLASTHHQYMLVSACDSGFLAFEPASGSCSTA